MLLRYFSDHVLLRLHQSAQHLLIFGMYTAWRGIAAPFSSVVSTFLRVKFFYPLSLHWSFFEFSWALMEASIGGGPAEANLTSDNINHVTIPCADCTISKNYFQSNIQGETMKPPDLKTKVNRYRRIWDSQPLKTILVFPAATPRI